MAPVKMLLFCLLLLASSPPSACHLHLNHDTIPPFRFNLKEYPAFASSNRRSFHHISTSPIPRKGKSTTTTSLLATSRETTEQQPQQPKTNTSKSARQRGIYARPSAAIERGSGFFIPGLEGSKIRFIFGITVLVADAANHILVGSRPGDVGQLVAESLAAFYGGLLLLQGSIELGVERGVGRGVSEPSETSSLGELDGSFGDNSEVDQGGNTYKSGDSGGIWGSDALSGNEMAIKSIQRMAQTVINFTPATIFCFANENDGVVYSFSNTADRITTNNLDEQKNLIKLASDAVSASRGGRVALPVDHPVSALFPESSRRCILVQRALGPKGEKSCYLIGSDKLLPSFTKNDLRWIGQLADYNDEMMSKT